MVHRTDLPVAVIGAGPVGLAAAAHLLERDIEPIVFESGSDIAANVASWGHVRVFSPWQYVVDEAAGRLLAETDWTRPDGATYPTGSEIVELYLRPLAQLRPIADAIHLDRTVTAVSRTGFDKMKSQGRDEAPFQIRTRSSEGLEESWLVRAVIDASGTSSRPNPIGAGGVPAIGELDASDRIVYGIPDVLNGERRRYAGKRIAVVGSGHSAFNVLLDLVDLADQESGTEITWVVRKPSDRLQNLYGGGINDALPARGELGDRVRRLVDSGLLRLVTNFRTTRITQTPEGLILASDDSAIEPVDEIIVATGLRPDLSFLSEVRLNLDPAVESPAVLAPLIDPNVHSCGSVPPHGAVELQHPETDFYLVGMKSYGRAPTFLMVTGYEQVRSVVAAIAGDWEAARDVRLVLPETGVCSSNILADRGVACCGTSTSSIVDAGQPGPCCDPADTSAAPSTCCGGAVPQLIQLNAAAKGSSCC